MFSGKLAAITAALLLSAAGAARADVEIDNKPTSNMSCVSGVCTATAQQAVLNVTDLANMLSTGDVAVKTGLVAKDIEISQPLTWSSTSRLTLDAQQSVAIRKQVTVAGQGGLTVLTNDTGQPHAKTKAGEFIIVPEHGSVQFWDLGSSLMIDGATYTLVGDIKTLASDIAANPSGFYALAKPYDASVDGTYSSSPILTLFTGIFDGLGNNVFNFSLNGNDDDPFGFFAVIWSGGRVRNFGVTDAIFNMNRYQSVALLAGGNQGTIQHCWTQGAISFTGGIGTAGLAGLNSGLISNSYARVKLTSNTPARGTVGGITGLNDGVISLVYSSGVVAVRKGDGVAVAGLVGENDQLIENSFSRSHVVDGKQNCCDAYFGGLVGENNGQVRSSYAAGKVTQNNAPDSVLGGLVGFDSAPAGNIKNTYWDIDKGVSDPSQGAGNISNDSGITGLTTAEFQAALPSGFNPKVWGQDLRVNGGFPYLRSLK